MERSPIHIDEFGTIRFRVFSDQGYTYEFEQEADSELLFVTVRDIHGRAEAKNILNTENPKNKDIVELYKEYIRESEDEIEEQGDEKS